MRYVFVTRISCSLRRTSGSQNLRAAQRSPGINCRWRSKQPKLKPAQEAHLVELWRAGKHTSAELAELFSVARSTRLPGSAEGWRAEASPVPSSVSSHPLQGPDSLHC